MSVSRSVLNDYMAQYLNINQFKDYGPNGLQVEGKSEITKLVCGVTACYDLFQAAINHKADGVIVHHGLFWQSDPQVIVGIQKNRLKILLENDINLWGYHLPLDCHLTVGNNAKIGQLMPVINIESHKVSGIEDLLWTAQLTKPQTAKQVLNLLAKTFGQRPLYLGNDKSQMVRRIAWCSGGAQKYIIDAKHLGADLYFSGEVSEQTMHLAKEYNIHYLSCGHHATERLGIQALASKIEREFSISCEFVDIYNPV